MRSVVTAKIKIPTTPEIVNTLSAYTKGLQFCVDNAWEHKIRNNIKLHYIVYKDLRLRFKLPSQLAIACISQVCGYVKKAKSKPIIKRASIGYNFPRSARLKGNRLIYKTLTGRQETIITIPDCYKKYFISWDSPTDSLLRIVKQGRAFFLFTFSKEVNAVNNTSQFVLGIDLGVNKLAVTSDNRFFGSAKVKQIKRKFKFLRGKLQSKGTLSAKRLLKKISGRETRYMRWVNHNISKDIVFNFDGNKIIMENLKGIRKQRRGKRMNYWISNWSFFQLQSFIQYKAERQGIEFVKVKPNYTSQICSKCGKLGSRSGNSFVCHCGFSLNADLNASRNLAHPMLVERQALVTVPYNLCNDSLSVLDIVVEHKVKSPAL